jgi:hypothetical protein
VAGRLEDYEKMDLGVFLQGNQKKIESFRKLEALALALLHAIIMVLLCSLWKGGLD